MSRETSELLELFGALLNGTLTPDGQARLDRLLREQARARMLYRRYLNLHAALHFCSQPRPRWDLPPSDVPEGQGDPVRAEACRPGPPRRRGAKSRMRRWLALAAGVLVLVGVSWLGNGSRERLAPLAGPGPVVGILSAAHGPVRVQQTRGERRAEVGMELHAADTMIVPADASAVVALEGRIRADLGPETTLAFSGEAAGEGRALYLHSGFLAVEAGPQPPGQPLHVFTPNARAEVLGTRFTLAAAPRQTRLRVAEGAVTLRPGPDGPAVTVPAGFGSGVADGVAMPLRPSQSGEVLIVESLERSPPSEQWGRFNREMASRLVSAHVQRLALAVAIKDHRELRAADLERRPLVIVSVAKRNVGFEDSLRRIGLAKAVAPVMCLEPIAFPVLGMTGSGRGADWEWGTPPARVRFPLPGHPLSGRRTGPITLPASIAWGRPAGEALRIAVLDDRPERAVLFAYDAGKQMVGAKAPARRVGLLLDPTVIVANPDVESWSLFEDAVNWCVEPTAGQPAPGW